MNRLALTSVLAGAMLSAGAGAAQEAPAAFDLLDVEAPLSIDIIANDPGCQVSGQPIFDGVIAALEDEGVAWIRFAETTPDHRLRVQIRVFEPGASGGCSAYLLAAFEQEADVELSFSDRDQSGYVTLMQYDAALVLAGEDEEEPLDRRVGEQAYTAVRHAVSLARSQAADGRQD